MSDLLKQSPVRSDLFHTYNSNTHSIHQYIGQSSKKKHTPLVTIINKNLNFKFIQLMMYMIFIIYHVHDLINESKMLIFAYNNDQMV